MALGLYLQSTQGMMRETIVNNIGGENTFISLTTVLFWIGFIVVIISIVIRPKKRKILIPAEATEAVEEAPQKRVEEASYEAQEEMEAGGVETEQAYEEIAPEEIVEEAPEESFREEEEEEKPKKLGEVVGFCPRCGAPVMEGIRYCRKCGLKLK
jgi:flagellar biosynthesis/type III secretory pathway M-ring protein FliF/YscJ